MLLRHKRSLSSQLRVLAAALLLSGILCEVTGWTPLLRAGPGMFLRGIVFALAVALLAVVMHAAVLRFRRGYLNELEQLHKSAGTRSKYARLGATITASCGEEMLLRGAFFGWLALSESAGDTAPLTIVAAFCLNAMASFIWHCEPKRLKPVMWRYALIQSLIGTLFAMAFYRSHALFLILTARALLEALEPQTIDFAISSPRLWSRLRLKTKKF